MPDVRKISSNPHTDIQVPNGFFRSRAYLSSTNVKDFPYWTSTHAIPLTRRTTGWICIVFWLLVAIVATGVTAWQVTIAIMQYFEYGVSTRTAYAFTQRVFPAVTACDANPYKRLIAHENAEIKKLMDTFLYGAEKVACSSRSNCNFTVNSTLDSYMSNYSMNGIKDAVTLQTKVQRLLVLIANADQKHLEPAKAQMDDFLQGCSFNTQDCYAGDWTPWRDPVMGNCFTFNMNANRSVNRAGPIYGLRAIFKTNASQYIESSSNVGMIVLDEYPFPDTFGIYIEPNTATQVGLDYRQISRLGHPYGNCTNEKPGGYLYSNLSYSTEGCQRSQYQQEIVRICGCYDPAYPAPANSSTSMCEVPKDVQCWSSVIYEINDDNNTCLEPCDEGSFEIARSSSRWPSGSLSTLGECEEGDYFNTSCLAMQVILDYNGLIKSYLRYTENGAFVEVYFENLSFQSLNETAALTLPTLFSNIGGQIGLWLGMYIISVVEIILLAGQIILSCLYPPISKPVAY